MALIPPIKNIMINTLYSLHIFIYGVNYVTNFKVLAGEFTSFQNTSMQNYVIMQFMHFRKGAQQLSKKGAP
jgi:hypothetical protein